MGWHRGKQVVTNYPDNFKPTDTDFTIMTDNTYTWTASAVVDFDTIATFHIDLLPARTSVGFSLREPKGTP